MVNILITVIYLIMELLVNVLWLVVFIPVAIVIPAPSKSSSFRFADDLRQQMSAIISMMKPPAPMQAIPKISGEIGNVPKKSIVIELAD